MRTVLFVSISALFSSAGAASSLRDLGGPSTSLAVSPAQMNILTGDFLTGFESGIFLREKED